MSGERRGSHRQRDRNSSRISRHQFRTPSVRVPVSGWIDSLIHATLGTCGGSGAGARRDSRQKATDTYCNCSDRDHPSNKSLRASEYRLRRGSWATRPRGPSSSEAISHIADVLVPRLGAHCGESGRRLLTSSPSPTDQQRSRCFLYNDIVDLFALYGATRVGRSAWRRWRKAAS
jgi:hypothetical protein